jgi:pilus assembly protein Flp/PilA
MEKLFTRLLTDELGTTAIEYGLIGALISVACIAAMNLVGIQLGGVYTAVSATIIPALAP